MTYLTKKAILEGNHEVLSEQGKKGAPARMAREAERNRREKEKREQKELEKILKDREFWMESAIIAGYNRNDPED